MITIKNEAKKIINRLPKNATWDDLLYELYIMKKIAVALDAISQGKTVSHTEAKKRLLRK